MQGPHKTIGGQVIADELSSGRVIAAGLLMSIYRRLVCFYGYDRSNDFDRSVESLGFSFVCY